MALFQTMAAGLPGLQAKATDIEALTLRALLGEATSKAGVAVNTHTAMQVSTVLACVRVLAEGVAQLPLKVFREGDDDSLTPARDLPAYELLYRRPNDIQSSFEFRETMMVHAALTGDGFAVKNVYKGQVRELLPLIPGTYQVQRQPNYGYVLHVSDPYGLTGTFHPDQLFHLKGPSWNAVVGLNAVYQAREAIGLAIVTEEAHERLHANGARIGGLISVDGALSDGARDKIMDRLEKYKGAINTGRTMVLDKGASFTPFTMTGVDAQHLDTRRFQIEEICRHFRVFPQMVGYADKTATFASAESFFLAHVIHSLTPWLERWEQAIWRDILRTAGPAVIARFNVEGLLRGDAASRAAYYASGILNGWLTRNEPRIREGLNPLPGLDAPLQPLNMTTVGDGQAQLAKSIGAVVTAEIKAMLGHNGGPPLDDAAMEALLEGKIGRVLSAANETHVRQAYDHLGQVLDSLPNPS